MIVIDGRIYVLIGVNGDGTPKMAVLGEGGRLTEVEPEPPGDVSPIAEQKVDPRMLAGWPCGGCGQSQ